MNIYCGICGRRSGYPEENNGCGSPEDNRNNDKNTGVGCLKCRKRNGRDSAVYPIAEESRYTGEEKIFKNNKKGMGREMKEQIKEQINCVNESSNENDMIQIIDSLYRANEQMAEAIEAVKRRIINDGYITGYLENNCSSDCAGNCRRNILNSNPIEVVTHVKTGNGSGFAGNNGAEIEIKGCYTNDEELKAEISVCKNKDMVCEKECTASEEESEDELAVILSEYESRLAELEAYGGSRRNYCGNHCRRRNYGCHRTC